ncbi:MAG: hypothetical protein IKC91_04125, partial [Clostridia bacterium]|nr:hypothetical protein [Clostridia bacterium]
TVEKTVKKRSFFTFLSLILGLVAVGIFAWQNLDFLTALDFGNTNYIFAGGFAVAGVLAALFALIGFAKPSKGCAVFSFLLFAVSTALNVLYVGPDKIMEIIQAAQDNLFTVVVLACAILATLTAFIGMFGTGTKKELIEVTVDEAEEADDELQIVEPDQDEEEFAPVADEATAEAPVAEEADEAEESPVEPTAAEEVQKELEEEEEADDFLKSLSPASKREFKKLFIDGKAPAYLPQYNIGGNNKRFFNSIFVYLGKIRTIISDNLLGEIYDYMMANK